MADERQQNSSPETGKSNAEEHSKSGNLFGKAGKIFLIIALVLLQAGAAYAVIDLYYEDIYKWISEMSPEGDIYYKFENLIVNPAHSGGERYLILTLAVEVNTASDAALMDKEQAKLVDKISYVLTTKTASELADLSRRESIKQELGIAINKTLGEKAVRNLFFTKFVLQ